MDRQFYLPLGGSQRFNFNPTDGDVVLSAAAGVRVDYVRDNDWQELEIGRAIPAPLAYEGLMRVRALDAGENHALLENPGGSSQSLRLAVNVFRVELAVDSNRDGEVDHQDPGKSSWVWGPSEKGAVLLVNNDRDISDASPVPGQYSEWSELVVEPSENENFPEGMKLVLSATDGAARRFTVYARNGAGDFERILGSNREDPNENPIVISRELPATGVHCFVEAHEYPGPFFEGLITIELWLLRDDRLVATDRVVFRVAPWIMTPHNLPVQKVFACRIETGGNSNDAFLNDLEGALQGLGVPLHIIPSQQHLGDRWIQDEIEFGYVKGASHTLPVVLDSPRDRGLDDFPEAALLGPDFGHFQLGGSTPNSLDSFGNLEVTPPVTVRGQEYPFGRIVFGGRRHGDYGTDTRQMMPEVRRFLYAQKIQAPFEIFTDWLIVGHVDEICCFVPAPTDKGFEVLVASPIRARAILERLEAEGHGDVPMFEGLRREAPFGLVSAEVTIAQLLRDDQFWEANERFQRYMDMNLEILSRELEVDDRHLIQIPVLFHPEPGRTAAFFPDMVNHIVIGNTSLVPKPHGPKIDGQCAFESAFENAVPHRDVRFIEDWYSYHEMLGEVHCGTNCLRGPFLNKNWWDFKPVGGFDI